MKSDEIVGWFTTENGTHIPLRKGQNKKEAISRFSENHHGMNMQEHENYVAKLGMEASFHGADSNEWKRWFNESQNLQRRKADLKNTTRKESSQNIISNNVNAYGEATSRYITSTTYERAKSRTQKDIDNWFRR